MRKGYLKSLWDAANSEYLNIILSMVKENRNSIMLDCGCDTGEFTMKIASKIKPSKIYGIEIVKERFREAWNKGITVYESDLNQPFPIESESIDVLLANQVIEHLYNTDNFIGEIFRVLKSSGYAIICTENLSSWHNIFALVLGWQAFSLSNISKFKPALGNPFGLRRGDWTDSSSIYDSHQHLRIFSYLGLKELFEAKGFVVEKIVGAGYYPLPHTLSKIICKLDTRHSAFLVSKLCKSIV